MKTLREIFEEHAHYGSDAGHADKGSTHSYIEKYAELFEPFRMGCSFMEMGLAMGESLRMWNKYFHKSFILGVDISVIFDFDSIIPLNDNDLNILEDDVTKDNFTGNAFDIIIDDASHMEDDQVKTFNMLKPFMKKGGLYIIEDILSLDTNRKRFESLHDNCEISDLRKVKGRFDDVLIIYRF